MSYELASNEVAFKAGNRVIIGTVVDDSNNNVLTLTNFRSVNGKPYGKGMPMEIHRNKLINNNVTGVSDLFNNSAFKKRSNNATANAEQKRLEAQAQANANAKKYQQSRSQNAALNGLSNLHSEPSHVPSSLVGNRPFPPPAKKWAPVQTEIYNISGRPPNASSSRDPRTNLLINNSNSWYAQTPGQETMVQRRIREMGLHGGLFPNMPSGLTIAQRKMILQGQQSLNAGLGLYGAPKEQINMPNGVRSVANRTMILKGQQSLNAGLGLYGAPKEQINTGANFTVNNRRSTYKGAGSKKTVIKKKPKKKIAPKKKPLSKK